MNTWLRFRYLIVRDVHGAHIAASFCSRPWRDGKRHDAYLVRSSGEGTSDKSIVITNVTDQPRRDASLAIAALVFERL